MRPMGLDIPGVSVRAGLSTVTQTGEAQRESRSSGQNPGGTSVLPPAGYPVLGLSQGNRLVTCDWPFWVDRASLQAGPRRRSLLCAWDLEDKQKMWIEGRNDWIPGRRPGSDFWLLH